MSDDFNRLCFEHDKCYGRSCVEEDCYFGGLYTQSDDCDDPFFSFCDSLGAHPNPLDWIICRVAHALHLRWWRPDCEDVPCVNGRVCVWDGSKGECSDTDSCVLCSCPTGDCAVAVSSQYNCVPGTSGPCPGIVSDCSGEILSCEKPCLNGPCLNYCSSPSDHCSTHFVGDAYRLDDGGGPYWASMTLNTCVDPPVTGISVIDDGFYLVFAYMIDISVEGNVAEFNVCNGLGAPCFGVPDGAGSALISSGSLSSRFSIFGLTYDFTGTCALE